MKTKIHLPKLLFYGLILVGGYLIGCSWTNKEENTSNNVKDEGMEEDARLTPVELATIDLFEKSAPSVVFITTTKAQRDFFSYKVTDIPKGSGTGFVWDMNGHIVTNYHVLEGADKASITLADGSDWDASLVGVAPDKDLAVLKIEAPRSKLKPIPVGNSDRLRVGQSVLAIGNPFGLDQTLTTGIISALGREIKSVSGIPIRNVIQTDAAINPGNSGGPLLNSSGQLIGVNTAIYSPSGAYAGIGFSIPVDVVKWVVPELLKYGRINRPLLGVELATSRQARQLGVKGALVLYVGEGSAAERAGIRQTYRDGYGRIKLGDVIIGLNNEQINSSNELIGTLAQFRPGDLVNITLYREGKQMNVKARLDGSR